MQSVFAPGWYVVARSAEVKTKPRGFRVCDRPLVAVRLNGKVAVFADRCPHRNAPLSMGRVRGETLECAYHGWRFNSAGECTKIPTRIGDEPGAKSRCLEQFESREENGFVWVFSESGVEPPGNPFQLAHQGESGYAHVYRSYEVQSSVFRVAENILDVPHTQFLHGGLFRIDGVANDIEVVVKRLGDVVEAHYIGEPRPPGLAGRLLSPKSDIVTHIDRFTLPSVTQVDYRLGRSHLLNTTMLTPISETQTQVHAVVTYKTPLPGWLLKWVMTPVVEKVFAQDKKMLAKQSERIEEWGGEQFASTEVDVLSLEIKRLLSSAMKGETPSPMPERRLRMRF